MLASFGIGFVSPWLLAGLLALPLLWILLRAVPPAPIQRIFPGVILLLGLKDDESQSDTTPWWLLLLRILALAMVIIGFAGPVLNPDKAQTSNGPLLILMDGSWGDAYDWPARLERVEIALEDARRAARPVALTLLTDPEPGNPEFLLADEWMERVTNLRPNPWEPDSEKSKNWATALGGNFETLWFSDGLERSNRTEIYDILSERGQVRVFEGAEQIYGLRPPTFQDSTGLIEISRRIVEFPAEETVLVFGLDPNGVERIFERISVEFQPGEGLASSELIIEPERRNRITRFQIDKRSSAAAVALSDDGLKRPKVALLGGVPDQESLQLLSPTHFLEKALSPSVDLINGSIGDIVTASPDVIILADIASLADSDAKSMVAWVESGGLLLRFAGPGLAGSEVSRGQEDLLMPVRLRAGGRTVGGTMSWGEPKKLLAFDQNSPFFGLTIPDDVEVTAQVIAEPDPNLSSRVIASLSDGTPLVTRKRIGAGHVVLFHVTANAEWSTLPLSGLFVEMLERLSVSGRTGQPDAGELAGTMWVAQKVLDGFGNLQDADNLAGVPGESIASREFSAAMPPGLFGGQDRTIALNVISDERDLAAAKWPAGTDVENFQTNRETALKSAFLIMALALLAADVIASIWVGGRLRGPVSGASVALIALMVFQPQQARAQEDAAAIAATAHVVLAHVITGNTNVDKIAKAGLRGLSDVLFRRTSVEPSDPVSVDIERDELAFFPFLYWPLTPEQAQPSEQAVARLNRYLQTGGMILFDTRDADVAGYGVASPTGRKLQQIASRLNIPALEPLPDDHVLTRTFYLLDNFPGRYVGRNIWVEASPPGAELAEGMPFRNLNDNVTPVVIGGNDWAAAWAVNETGNWMFPIGRGSTGDRQREIAYRFGVNVIMYVLTGNYKSDQVHVPALLDRLGQ